MLARLVSHVMVALRGLVAPRTAADVLQFQILGYVMDRWGRLMPMVPALSLMAAARRCSALPIPSGGRLWPGL